MADRDRRDYSRGNGMVRNSADLTISMKTEEATLTINEIYHSIQGESTWAGRPCVFVQLTFCNLRCNYCDTAYAFYEGEKMPLPEIVEGVTAVRCHLVDINGVEALF